MSLPSRIQDRSGSVQFGLHKQVLAYDNKHHQKNFPIFPVYLNEKGRVILTGGSSGLRIGQLRKYFPFERGNVVKSSFKSLVACSGWAGAGQCSAG